MDFFRNLFKQEPQKFEKIIKNPINSIQHLEKIPFPDIKLYLKQSMSPIYWEESDSILSIELNSLSSPDDINKKISELEHFESLCQNSLYFELDQQSKKFTESLASVQSLNRLLIESKNLSTSAKETNVRLQSALAENYIKVVYLSKKTSNFNLLIKEFTQFEQYANVFYIELNKSIFDGCYIKAIECCKKAKEFIGDSGYSKYRLFDKISEYLENKQEKILKEMNKKLFTAFFYNFEPSLYENLILAYVFVSPAEEVVKMFQSNLGVINDSVYLAFSEAVPNLPKSSIDYMIKITPNSYYSSLIMNVLQNLTNLMHNFYCILEWHKENQKNKNSGFLITKAYFSNRNPQKKAIKSFRKVYKGLKTLKKPFWDQIESQVETILKGSCQIKQLKHGEMRNILEWFSSFVDCSEHFSSLPLSSIKKIIIQKCSDYFFTVHSTNWVKLVNILEVEQWTKLPIPKTFEITSEISKNLKNLEKFSVFTIDQPNPFFSFTDFMKSSPFSLNKTRKSLGKGPISQFPRVSIQENPPVFCTSAINLFKILGNYLELLSILSPISFEVFHKMTEIFEFYVYEIFVTFSLNESQKMLFQEIPIRSLTTEKLDKYYDVFLYQSTYRLVQVNIARIKDIIESLSGECGNTIRQLLRSPTSPASLTKALIALECYKNLLFGLSSCKKFINSAISQKDSSVIDLFFNTHEELYENLSDFIITPLLSRNFELSWLPNFIKSTNWEEKRPEASGYIFKLLKYFSEFSTYLSDPDIVPLTSQPWVIEKLAKISFDKIFEGFSEVKSCNLSGREQMKKDLRYFCRKIRKITKIDSVKEIKEYVSVWKYSADEIVDWVLANDGISLKKQKNLLSTAPGIVGLNDKERGRIVERVEKFYWQQIYN